MIEKLLLKLHERSFVQLCGNGTTALYLVLTALNLKKRYIGIPNGVCSNVILAVYFSENIPVFLDIDKETLGISTIDLLDKIKMLDCVIAVHSYGSVCEIGKIEKICRSSGVYLIEDFAVAQGTYYQEKPAGSFGIASIVSFGSGKIIDCGHGGAVLTDDKDLEINIGKSLRPLNDHINGNDDVISKISNYHTHIYNSSLGGNINKYAQKYKKMCLDNSKHYLSKFNEKYRLAISEKLQNISKLLDYRKKNAEFLYKFFSQNSRKSLSVFQPKYDSAFWRFNIFIDSYRNDVLKYLLKKNYLVSSWYHSVDLIFEQRINNKNSTPNSDWVGDNILNIWVNELIDDSYLGLITKDILNIIDIREKSGNG